MTHELTLDVLARLVGHSTVAGTPNGDLVAEVADRLERVGAAVTILDAHRSDAVNLHAVLGPADAPGGLLFAAHSDVVSVDGQPWTHDPFVLRVEGGRADGRGTADMKGFLATVLVALGGIDGRRLRRPVHVALSSDEELGCRGVGSLLDMLAALPVGPAAALVGEPTELRVADRHKGKCAVRVHLRGRAVHSSLAPAGVNAVAYAAQLICGLLELGDELASAPGDHAYTVPHTTVGIGPIQGGVSVNVVPDHCRLDFELRTLPEDDPELLMDRVRALIELLQQQMRAIHPDASITLEPQSSYPGLLPAADPAYAHAVAAVTGEAANAAVDFGTEAGLYQQRLAIPVVVCGPGSMTNAHQADEFVALDQLARSEQLVRELAEGLCVDHPTTRP